LTAFAFHESSETIIQSKLYKFIFT